MGGKVHFNAECGGMCNSAESAECGGKCYNPPCPFFPESSTEKTDMKITNLFKSATAKLPAAVIAAAQSEDATEVQRLIDKGADVNAKNENGSTPLMLAAGRHAAEAAKVLIDNGADVNVKTDMGATPLHIAVQTAMDGKGGMIVLKVLNVAKVLIDNGADVNAKSKSGMTPLHFAAAIDADDFAKLMLEKGANINAEDNNGMKPLDLAAMRGAPWVAKVLIDNGAEVSKLAAAMIAALSQSKKD